MLKTTYVEIGYNYEFLLGIKFVPVAGVVLNNKAQYYSYADYDKPSAINFGCKVSKDIKWSKKNNVPIWVDYTYNAASNTVNLEPFGKQFLVVGVTFLYYK